MLRVAKVSKTVIGGRIEEIPLEVPEGEVWILKKLRFRVPYNVFKLELYLDDVPAIPGIVLDETMDELDLYDAEVRNRILFRVTNTQRYDYLFVATLIYVPRYV